jgi:hypothetical protein
MADDSSEIVREGAEAASFANVKSVGEASAVLQNLSNANAVAHQQAMWQMYPALVAKSVDAVLNLQPAEGTAAAGILQQLLKGAQSSNPQTGQTPG